MPQPYPPAAGSGGKPYIGLAVGFVAAETEGGNEAKHSDEGAQ